MLETEPLFQGKQLFKNAVHDIYLHSVIDMRRSGFSFGTGTYLLFVLRSDLIVFRYSTRSLKNYKSAQAYFF